MTPLDEFLRCVVVRYSETDPPDPKCWDLAAEILHENPALVASSIHAASAAGDVAGVRRHLDTDATRIGRNGGPHDWPPLMYAAYSRLPGVSTLAVGKLLLERGADPNPFYLWGGQYRFTALTGVFGEGESGAVRQPPHPEYEAFARLLLDAGADPNDSQAAYNRMFTPDSRCLELLLEYGLDDSHRNNWSIHEGDRLVDNPEGTLSYQLNHAVRSGNRDRVRLLLPHVDVETSSQGRSPYEWARLFGHDEIVQDLVAHGAKAKPLREVDAFRSACMSGARARAESMLAARPEVLVDVQREHPELMTHAIDRGRTDAVALMLDLGFPINPSVGRPPIHQAAWHGDLAMIDLLLQRGADTTLREPGYFATPIGFASYAGQDDAVAALWDHPMDVFAAAGLGQLQQLAAHLDRDPTLLAQRFADIRPRPDKSCDDDWKTPLAFAVANGNVEAARVLLERGADPSVRAPDGTQLLDIAQRRRDPAMCALLAAR